MHTLGFLSAQAAKRHASLKGELRKIKLTHIRITSECCPFVLGMRTWNNACDCHQADNHASSVRDRVKAQRVCAHM
jgi:hypothetical protein